MANFTTSLPCGCIAQGLKNHAVTMFEVGKLADESMDSFLVELGKVPPTCIHNVHMMHVCMHIEN